eukprot:13320498-Alexandrium_andersonii.AAC.1
MRASRGSEAAKSPARWTQSAIRQSAQAFALGAREASQLKQPKSLRAFDLGTARAQRGLKIGPWSSGGVDSAPLFAQMPN